MKVYVVTNPENGWDCVNGVFLSLLSLAYWVEARVDFEEESLADSSLEDLEAILDLHNCPHVIHEIYAE